MTSGPNSNAVESAINNFKSTNPDKVKWFGQSLEWIIHYLVCGFDIEHYLNCSPHLLDRGQLETWRNSIIHDIARQCRWKKRFIPPNEEACPLHEVHFRAIFGWFLEYESGTETHGQEDIKQKRLWGRIRTLFDNDNRPVMRKAYIDGTLNCEFPGASTGQDTDILAHEIRSDLELEDECPLSSSESPRDTFRARMTRNLDRVQTFTKAQGRLTVLPNLGCIDRMAILHHVLIKVKEAHPRYTRLLDSMNCDSIKVCLDRNLNPKVKMMCNEGSFDLDQDLFVLPISINKAGVYLHILWQGEDTGRFWLYVGQAINLKDRIQNHSDHRYRNRHFSLHYNVWNSLENVNSLFVILYTTDDPGTTTRQLLLNLTEIWMACLFQTLPYPSLEKYLPAKIKPLWGSHHLNIALPLWQSFTDQVDGDSLARDSLGGREAFTAFLQSSDQSVRRWAESWRDGFNQLRNSPDLRLRDYYRSHICRSLRLAHDELDTQKMLNYRAFLQGKETPVLLVPKASMTYRVCVGQLSFTINQEFGLKFKDGDKVFVQLHLSNHEHPMVYVRNNLPIDPARQLAISVSGCDQGGVFHVWLVSHGVIAESRR